MKATEPPPAPSLVQPALSAPSSQQHPQHSVFGKLVADCLREPSRVTLGALRDFVAPPTTRSDVASTGTLVSTTTPPAPPPAQPPPSSIVSDVTQQQPQPQPQPIPIPPPSSVSGGSSSLSSAIPIAVVPQLSKRDAQAMFLMLFVSAGAHTSSFTKGKRLRRRAFIALELFLYFTVHDEEFQDIVEVKSAMELRELRLEWHYRDGDEAHKDLVIDLIAFLSANIVHLRNWRIYVPVTDRFLLDEIESELALAREQMEREHSLQQQQKQSAALLQAPKLALHVEFPTTPTIQKSKDSDTPQALPPTPIFPRRRLSIISARLSADTRLPPEGLYYDVEAELVLESFRVIPQSGLSLSEVERRRDRYGTNELPKQKKPSILLMLAKQVFDFMVLILIGATILAAVMGDFKASATLLVVIIVNVIIGFTQEFKAERALASLMKLSVQKANVVRESQIDQIPATELVPGDIVILEEGTQVPADLRLFEEIDLCIMESLLTGESEPCEKDIAPIHQRQVPIGDRRNMAFMSTVVTKGHGKGVVVSVGRSTEIGKISKHLSSTRTPMTPLQKRLRVLGIVLVLISVVLCALVIAIGLLRGNDVANMIKVGVSLAVSVIPEGLVAVTTVTMALGVQRMAKKNAIVRRLSAVESLGSVTYICSDKTGTLTEGKMKATELWACGQTFEITGPGTRPEGSFKLEGKQIELTNLPPHLVKMLMISALCNNSAIQPADAEGLPRPSKEKTHPKEKVRITSQVTDHVEIELPKTDSTPSAAPIDIVEIRPSFPVEDNAVAQPRSNLEPPSNNLTFLGEEGSTLIPTTSEPNIPAHVEIPISETNTLTVVCDQKSEEPIQTGSNNDSPSLSVNIEPSNTVVTTPVSSPTVPTTQIAPVLPTAASTISLESAALEIHRNETNTALKPVEYELIGDPTEVALLMAAMKANLDKDVWVSQRGLVFENEFAFDSTRKRMTVVYSKTDAEPKKKIFVVLAKGAAESILTACSHLQSGPEEMTPLTQDAFHNMEKQSLLMAEKGLRVLGLAYKLISENDVTEQHNITAANFIESDLCFLGFAGIIDPPREHVASAIETCRNAGIHVCMITGDHPVTAKSIAKALHIVDLPKFEREGLPPQQAPPATGKHPRQQLVLKGADIDDLAASGRWKDLNPFPQVFARVSPENKLQIIDFLQKRGQVVAMTGDGVNDSIAIKKADVGVAMGITGTDITKQAAGIVLADDNFQSIVDAVQEGRRTYDNIKKFIFYLLSCNFAEIGLMLSAVAIDAPLPLSPIQILWANLIADTPPALSLGVESPEQNIMSRKPRNPKSGIFTFRTVLLLLYYSASMSILPLAGLLIADRVEAYALLHAQTLTFCILVSVQLVHAFLSRSMQYSVIERHPFGNRWLLAAIVLSGSLLVLSLYIPGINTLLDLVPLTWWDWGKIGIAIAIHVVLVESMKLIVRLLSLLLRKKNSTFYNGI